MITFALKIKINSRCLKEPRMFSYVGEIIGINMRVVLDYMTIIYKNRNKSSYFVDIKTQELVLNLIRIIYDSDYEI